MLPWYTGKAGEHVNHSHINPSSSIAARSWLRGSRTIRLGSEITYSFRGINRKFRPDFLVRLANRKMLVLELKGQDNREQQTKREFLGEWVRIVNRHGEFCAWGADVSRNPTDTHDTLQRHGSAMDT
jgi:type III restriction enzyme